MLSLGILAVFVGMASPAMAASAADWRSQSIYFMLTDRFARTDNSTTATCDANMGNYCGGSWQGIINHLDYIQGMGFTAIWITPITKQLNQSTSDGEAYHGYWQQDIYSINENYGTVEDLQALSSALHDRNMYLMVDVVTNHMGYAGSGDSVDYSVFNPFNSQDYFHPYCEITDYSNLAMVEQCWEGDTIVSLPDLNTESTEVQGIWNNWISGLVSNYSVDGLRIDSVLEVQKDFWTAGFTEAAGVYTIGEVDNGDESIVCPYQEVLDGFVNYPLYYPLLNAFKSTSGSISGLYNMINTLKDNCKDTTLMGTFAENHDVPRFGSSVPPPPTSIPLHIIPLTYIPFRATNDMSLAQNAAAFTIMSDGIPIIYAGQEQHYQGGNVPNNREAVWLSGYNTDSELYKLISQANAVRNQAIYRNSSYLTYKNYPIYQDDTTLAMRKGYDGTQTVTVLSNLGEGGSEYTLSLGNTGFNSGDSVTEIITCTSLTVDDNSNVPVPMASGAPRIIYPTSELEGSVLCRS
ncbi:family 13 alpha amylase in complex with acarbose [Penicillium chermesinum]|uniref:alpha-amylase n=1 Tax=Penicillium chermesinum TaxID=63820 RepID=A0A9W9NBV0_9EURO|nr:family 13 alpha amylase in complex with acarbose [Penicillium chermesinum]KAJ5216985.1 family 13 alpha amylase in complex with acarbose [Penicillium chermesinum]KAJ6171399.1 family 13 alpha amylase in complex with acarbose [Penicillium chermesinum]